MVVEQKDALGIYFEALLREPAYEPLQVSQGSRPLAEPSPVVVPLFVPPVSVPLEPRMELKAPHEESATMVVVEAGETDVPLPRHAGGVPGWAASPFQALLFRVAGLTLAVPLAELSGVQEWQDGAVTPMLGRLEWYLGLMQYRGRQVPVVDTAQLVLPPDRLEKLLAHDSAERLGHVVFIQEGQWGLACDAVGEVISLQHEMVKWRTSRAKRSWLAGTVLEHMCAIIDPPAFGEMLRTGIADLPEMGASDKAETER